MHCGLKNREYELFGCSHWHHHKTVDNQNAMHHAQQYGNGHHKSNYGQPERTVATIVSS